MAGLVLAAAGCGASTSQFAGNLKSYLQATQMVQIQCTSQGTDGNGNPLRSCQVAFQTAGCQGSSNGAPLEESTTVMVDGTTPEPGQPIGLSGCPPA